MVPMATVAALQVGKVDVVEVMLAPGRPRRDSAPALKRIMRDMRDEKRGH